MPVATVSVEEIVKKDLKSLPGGFVRLRYMSYGESLERRAIMKLTINTKKGQKDLTGEMAMANARIQQYEYAHCVVDHNLTDEQDRPLDLHSERDLKRLHPRIGQEIEGYISDMNNFEDDEEAEQGN